VFEPAARSARAASSPSVPACRQQQQPLQPPEMSLARTPSIVPPALLRPPSRSKYNALPKLELGGIMVTEPAGGSARRVQLLAGAPSEGHGGPGNRPASR
jgi:hypothetical protein